MKWWPNRKQKDSGLRKALCPVTIPGQRCSRVQDQSLIFHSALKPWTNYLSSLWLHQSSVKRKQMASSFWILLARMIPKSFSCCELNEAWWELLGELIDANSPHWSPPPLNKHLHPPIHFLIGYRSDPQENIPNREFQLQVECCLRTQIQSCILFCLRELEPQNNIEQPLISAAEQAMYRGNIS